MGEFSPLVQVQALQEAISEYRVEGIIVQPRLGQSITSTLETADVFVELGTFNWGEVTRNLVCRAKELGKWEERT